MKQMTPTKHKTITFDLGVLLRDRCMDIDPLAAQRFGFLDGARGQGRRRRRMPVGFKAAPAATNVHRGHVVQPMDRQWKTSSTDYCGVAVFNAVRERRERREKWKGVRKFFEVECQHLHALGVGACNSSSCSFQSSYKINFL